MSNTKASAPPQDLNVWEQLGEEQCGEFTRWLADNGYVEDTAANKNKSVSKPPRTVSVTFFPDQSAQSQTVRSMTLAELGDLILKTSNKSKKGLPWLKLAAFGKRRTKKNCLRHNDNVLEITGVELDYDAKKITFDKAVAVANRAGLAALLYTSANYTDAAPKWRILLPTSQPLPPAERAKLVARVNGLYGGVFDDASFVISQAYYYGSVNKNPAHRVRVLKGDCIDRRSDLDAGAIGKDSKPFVEDLYNVQPLPRAESVDPFRIIEPIGKIQAALSAIPNTAEIDRTQWFNIGQSVHEGSGGSDDGLAAWVEWTKSWQGWPSEEAFKECEATCTTVWRSMNPHSITKRSLYALADKASPEWRKEQVMSPQDAPTVEFVIKPKPKPTIPGFSTNWCDVTQIPRRQWLYEQHYIRGFATASIAPGGVGKSTKAIIDGICMASGLPLLGVEVTEQVKVWYWNGEEPHNEIARRMHAVCQHYKIDPYSIANTFHFTSGLDEFPIKLVTSSNHGITVNEKLFADIVAFIQANDIAVMIIDPLISSHGVPENDNVAMDVVAKSWGRVAALTNCNTEMVHHTRKPQRGDSDSETFSSDARGAGSLMDAVRASRVFSQMTEKEAGEFGVEDRFEHFRVNRGKVNMTRRGAAAWFKLVSVVIGNGPLNDPQGGDNVQTIESWKPPDVLAKVTTQHMHAVRAKAASGEYLRNFQAKEGWIGVVIGQVVGLDPEAQRGQVEKILKAWINIGVLKEVPRKDKKSMERTFVEPGEWSE